MLLRCDDGLAEARLLHPGQAGFFAVMRRLESGGVSSRCYRMGQMDAVVSAMRSAPDAYLSQGSFVAPRRQVKLLKDIRAAWVDLDCYNIGAQPTAAFVDEVLALAGAMGIPRPTYVVRSGRGAYAKWIFEQPISGDHLMQWRELQSTLVAIYRALGADVKARDAARVLRALGTRNSKVERNATVELMWSGNELVDYADLCATAATARFVGRIPGLKAAAGWEEEIAAQEAAATREEAGRGRARAGDLRNQLSLEGMGSFTDLQGLKRFGDQREPILMDRRSHNALNWSRFLDLRDLALRRGGIERGWRDEYLFWMANSLAHAEVIDRTNFWREVGELASFMDPAGFSPTSDGSMGTLYRKICEKWTVTRSGARRPALYTPSNEHLIELFQITPEEQREMKTLIGPEEKRRRRDATAPGRDERRLQRRRRDEQVRERLAAGDSAPAVAKELGVARWQVYRIREAMSAAPALTAGPGETAAAPPPSAAQPSRRRPARIGGGLLNDIASQLARGTPRREIRAALGLSETALYRVCRDLRRRETTLEPQPLEGVAAEVLAERRALLEQATAARREAARLRGQAQLAQQRLAASLSLQRLKRRLAAGGRSDLFEDSEPEGLADEQAADVVVRLQQQARAAAAQAARLADDLLKRSVLRLESGGQSTQVQDAAIDQTPPGICNPVAGTSNEQCQAATGQRCAERDLRAGALELGAGAGQRTQPEARPAEQGGLGPQGGAPPGGRGRDSGTGQSSRLAAPEDGPGGRGGRACRARGHAGASASCTGPPGDPPAGGCAR